MMCHPPPPSFRVTLVYLFREQDFQAYERLPLPLLKLTEIYLIKKCYCCYEDTVFCTSA